MAARPDPVDLGGFSSSGTSNTTATLRGGSEPTIDQRLAIVEQRVVALEREGPKRDAKLREQMWVDLQRGLSAARHQARDQDRALREFLATMLTGSLLRQGWGVSIFAVGGILSVTANIVA